MSPHQIHCRLRNARRTQPARFRRLTAPEALEVRAIPGGSLLELLFGAPLINPFFALLGADSDLQDTRESPGLASRSEDRLIRVGRSCARMGQPSIPSGTNFTICSKSSPMMGK